VVTKVLVDREPDTCGVTGLDHVPRVVIVIGKRLLHQNVFPAAARASTASARMGVGVQTTATSHFAWAIISSTEAKPWVNP
jgi:hypothetical protein